MVAFWGVHKPQAVADVSKYAWRARTIADMNDEYSQRNALAQVFFRLPLITAHH